MRWPWSRADPDRALHACDLVCPETGSGRALSSAPDRADPRAGVERAPSPALASRTGPRPSRGWAGPAAPVWLLDVDGVLNAHDPGWNGDVAEGWARADRGRFRIRWSPALVHGIRTLAAGDVVEVRWATTWVPWIDAIEGLLGLPPWALAYDGPYEGSGTPATPTPWRKLDAALAVVEDEGRPLIWTDDDAIPTVGEELDRLTSGGQPALLVRPHHRHGLQPADLADIGAFIRSFG